MEPKHQACLVFVIASRRLDAVGQMFLAGWSTAVIVSLDAFLYLPICDDCVEYICMYKREAAVLCVVFTLLEDAYQPNANIVEIIVEMLSLLLRDGCLVAMLDLWERWLKQRRYNMVAMKVLTMLSDTKVDIVFMRGFVLGQRSLSALHHCLFSGVRDKLMKTRSYSMLYFWPLFILGSDVFKVYRFPSSIKGDVIMLIDHDSIRFTSVRQIACTCLAKMFCHGVLGNIASYL